MSKAKTNTPSEEIDLGTRVKVLRDIPFQLGRYRVVQRIAIRPSGGEVFLAIDNKLSADSRVVIKLLAHGRGAEREAEQASKIDHPNVARVTDWGRFEGRQFVVYEYVEGEDLSGAHGALRSREAVSLMSLVARGVHRLHQMGDVHGDIKPDNIMLTEHGPKVLDFGSAVRVGERSPCSETFGSPEQMDIGATFASDVYGLGKTIDWLSSDRDTILTKIIDRATVAKPEHRYEDAGALAVDLEAWLARRPITWTKPGVRRVGWLAMRHPITSAVLPIAVAGCVWMGVNFYQAYTLLLRENTLMQSVLMLGQAKELSVNQGPKTDEGPDFVVLHSLHNYIMSGGHELQMAAKVEALAWCIRADAAVDAHDIDAMELAAEALARFDKELSEFEPGCPTHASVIAALMTLFHEKNLNNPKLKGDYFARFMQMN